MTLEELLRRQGQPAGAPPPPPGFVPVQAARIAPPPPPPGFVPTGSAPFEAPVAPPVSAPVTADVNPEGTGVGRAFERGVLRTRAAVPQLQATKASTMVSDAAAGDDLLRQVILENTGLPSAALANLDLSGPEAASQSLSQMGYSPGIVNTIRQVYDIRAKDAALAVGNEGAILDEGVAALQEAARLNSEAQALPFSPGADEFSKVFSAAPDTVMGTLKTFASDPVGAATFLGETAAESGPQIAANAVATLATRSPALGAALMGMGTVAQEFGPSVAEFMNEKNIAISTPEEARALLLDQNLMSEAASRGIGRGYVMVLAELAGQGAAVKTFGKTATGNALAQTGVQAATGAGGETAARLATGQELSAKEIMVEGLAEGVTAPVEVGPAIINDLRGAVAPTPVAAPPLALPPPPPTAPTPPPPPPGFVPVAGPEPEPAAPAPGPVEVDPVTPTPGLELADPTAEAQAPVPGPEPVAPAAPVPVETEQVAPPAPEPDQASGLDTPEIKPAALPVEPAPVPVGNVAPENAPVPVPETPVGNITPEPKPAPVEAEAAPVQPRAPTRPVKSGTPKDKLQLGGAYREVETPAGRKVAFVRNPPGSDTMYVGGGEYYIIPLNPDGTERSLPKGEDGEYAQATRTYSLNELEAKFAEGGLDKSIDRMHALADQRTPTVAPVAQAPVVASPASNPADVQTPAADASDFVFAPSVPAPNESPLGMSMRYERDKKREALERSNYGRPKAQAEMDALTAEIDARTVAAEAEAKANSAVYDKPADTQARFDKDVAEIDALAESLKRKYGLDPDAMPTANYKLRRVSGSTSYQVKTGEPLAAWKKQMARGRSGMTPASQLGADTTPSVGTKQRFADAVDNSDFEADADTDAEETQSRAPRGGFTPGFENVSFSDGGSVFEEAYRDAGVEPDEGVLMPPGRRVKMLADLLSDKFGMAVDRASDMMRLKANDATAQLLDAYRNGRMMLHVLGLPAEAMGLGGTLSLTLEKFKGRYLGMYNSGTKTIHMPGRSNSFAHEWAHALDNYLRDQLTPGAEKAFLSQVARGEGLNPLNSIQEAYVNLINRMFFDETALALRMMDLETKAAAVDKDGDPTKGAEEARTQLEKLAAGNTRLRVQASAYRKDSGAYAPAQSSYYQSVHEMLARAFEAFVAHKMEMAGTGAQNFVTKGDAAYLSDADRRLEMTFPKATERALIFDAFEGVFHHLRLAQTLGTGQAQERPADTDLVDPSFWTKAVLNLVPSGRTQAAARGIVQNIATELRAVGNGLAKLGLSPVASLRSGASTLALNAGLMERDGTVTIGRGIKQLAVSARWLVSSMRGFAKYHIKHQPTAAQPMLRWVMAGAMTDPGTGRDQTFTVEEVSERATASASTSIMSVLKANKIGAGLSDADNDTLRALMYGEKPPATKGMKAVAAELRRIMDRAYEAAIKAGVEMGYVEVKGYLPRIIRAGAVEDNRDGFVRSAAKVYGVQFGEMAPDLSVKDLISLATSVSLNVQPMSDPTNGPFGSKIKALRAAQKAVNQAQKPVDPALVDTLNEAREALTEAIREDYTQTKAVSWMERILIGDGHTFDSLGPDANFKQTRGLPPEADEILKEFYETDVMALVHNYTHSTSKRAAYQAIYGTSAGVKKLDEVLTRPDVRAAVRKNPSKYDTTTPAGRLNILRDLANPKTDDLKEIAFNEALKEGADVEAIMQLRSTIESVTGRSERSKSVGYGDRLASAVYVVGTLALLPKAAWTSVAEPVTFFLRTGDGKSALKTFGFYAREAVRTARSVKELAALSEMVGVVSTPLHDALMLNRMGDGNNNDASGNIILSKFFRANLLAQLTNAQRRASLAGGFYWMQGLAQTVQQTTATDPARAKTNAAIARAEFRDLGVAEGNIDAFAAWLAGKNGLPSLDDLQTPEGQQFAGSVARFVDQTIQNPRRADKAQAVQTPMGRLAFGLTSFIYTFYRNIHAATALRTKRDMALARENGMGEMEAKLKVYGGSALRLSVGFSSIFVAQMLVGAVRAAIFDAERWEEKQDDEELYEWLAALAFSRTGVLGPWDVVMNSVTGLRYERDLTSMAAGAHLGYFMSQIGNMINGLPKTELGPFGVGSRNTPKNNTSEHTAAKAFYRMLLAPAASAALSAIPVAGALGTIGRAAALQYSTSNTASSGFADAVMGEKTK